MVEILVHFFSQDPYDTDKMSEAFIDLFTDKAFSVGQPVSVLQIQCSFFLNLKILQNYTYSIVL